MLALNYTTFASHPKTIHFVGISGIGMSALALLCLQRGWRVQGSTLAPNACTDALVAQGAEIFFTHKAEHIDASVECVVYSSAISNSNPEIQSAALRNLPILHRSDLLRAFAHPLRPLAISGTHGKTTTTSLLGHVLYTDRKDPLILSGGMMAPWNSPVYPGQGSIAVIEADESDRSHINFSSLSGAILTNVEPEHLENYGGSVEHVWQSFQVFLQLAKDFAVVCSDAIDPNSPWIKHTEVPITFYGTDSRADFTASNLRPTPSGMRFDCQTPSGPWLDMDLNLWGHHNALNALAVIATCVHLGLSEQAIRTGLSSFLGVSRRMTPVGTIQGIPIIDDYAHHPTEIHAVLKTLRDRGYKNILAVCQPHRYTRLRDTMSLFANCFDLAKTVALTPVYSAGEPPIAGVNSAYLEKKLAETRSKTKELDVVQIPEGLSNIPVLRDLIAAGGYDIVICMGAGDITETAKNLAPKNQSLAN